MEVLSKAEVNDLITERLIENNLDLLTKMGQSVRAIIREEVDASLDRKVLELKAELNANLKNELAPISKELAAHGKELAALRKEQSMLRSDVKNDVRKELDLFNHKLEETIGKILEKKLKNRPFGA